MPTAEPKITSVTSTENTKIQPKECSIENGDSDDELSDDNEMLLNIKDSRLLLANKSSTDDRVSESKPDKKKISFTDSEELTNENNNAEEGSIDALTKDHSMPAVGPTRSTNGRVLGRMLVEGSDEPMRCWMTEGDHPRHPASNNCANVKVMSERPKDSADSILRSSDEFILGEKRVGKQISLPKKVSISTEPPTTFLRDVPPAENTEPEHDSIESTVAKVKSEAELAAAAAAALKEDWRKKTDLETTDLDEDDKIIFKNANFVEDSQILQISDDEASENGPKE